MNICEDCGRSFERPSFYSGCAELHPEPTKEQRIVEEIEQELDNRRLGWVRLDEEIQQEIRDALALIILDNN